MSAPLDNVGSVTFALKDSAHAGSDAGVFRVEVNAFNYGDPMKLRTLRDRVKAALAEIDPHTTPLDAEAAVQDARAKFTEAAFAAAADLFVAQEVRRKVAADHVRANRR